MYPPQNAPELDIRLQAIRKTTVAFASLFKNIPFIRYNQDGTIEEQQIVPIVYGNKEKYVKRLGSTKDSAIANEKVQITLPRIEYGLVDMTYDASRRLNQTNKITGCSSDSTVYVNAPVPYNFNFEIVLYTRNVEDANQIMEYILPHFYPDYNIKVNFVPAAGIIKNIPITFTGESEDEDSSGSFDSAVRSVFRTLNFVARSYIFQAPNYYKPILTTTTNINILQNTNNIALASGNGVFYVGDTVFQGSSYDRASAAAVVDSWNTHTNILQISPIFGKFSANSTIKNLENTANYIILNTNNSGLAYTTIITPTPNTYPVVGPYDYIINTTDYTE